VADGLKGAIDKHGPEGVAVFVSPRVTTEAAYGLRTLAERALGTTGVGSLSLERETALFDALERAFGHAGSTASYDDVRSADVILMIDSDIAEEQTVLGVNVRKAVRNGARLIVLSPEETRMARLADTWVRLERGDMGSALAAMLERRLNGASGLPFAVKGVDGLRAAAKAAAPNVDSAVLSEVSDAFASAERGVMIANAWSFEAASASRDATLAVALATFAGAPAGSPNGIPLVLFARSKANGQGLTDIGLAGESARLARELRQGAIKAALIVGEDPVGGADDPDGLLEALGRLDFLVVADSVPTGTTSVAHVVLPLAAPGESSGSFTSAEHRVQTVAGPLAPPAGLTELELVSALSSALGAGSVPTDAAAARAAMDVEGYPSSQLPPDGVRWAEGLFNGGLRTADGKADLALPDGDRSEPPFDPRWTDAVEVRFSRAVEEFGLQPHVVKRSGVRA